MPEIRTCEQYVLNLLEENQNEVARLQNVVIDLNHKIGHLNEKFDRLKEILIAATKYYNYSYAQSSLSFRLDEGYDKELYDSLIELIPELIQN